MKSTWRIAGQVVLLTVLLPQVYVLAYYFPLLITGVRRWEFLQTVAGLGLGVSWVAAPFVAGVSVLYHVLVARRAPHVLTFLSVFAAGMCGVAIWNNLIFDLFGYLRSILPLLLCCCISSGYALAARAYRKGLPDTP